MLASPVVSRSEAAKSQPHSKQTAIRLDLAVSVCIVSRKFVRIQPVLINWNLDHLMSFLFTPASNRHAHMKHSPSLTLERGETRLRSPKPIRVDERTSFYTNMDTGVDWDGELKSGFQSGDIRYIHHIPFLNSTP